MDYGSVNRSGRELVGLADGVIRKFRILRATPSDPDGEDFVIKANSQSSLTAECGEEDGFFPEEPWVFGWTATPDYLIKFVFVAEVRGMTRGNPGHYTLGPITHLRDQTLTPPAGFRPAQEDDDLFGDENQGGTSSAGTAADGS